MMTRLTKMIVACAMLLPTLVVAQGEQPVRQNDKEIQRIVRAQETAIRRVNELRRRVDRLQKRMAQEGRQRSAELLETAIKRLDDISLTDQMSEISEQVRTGQAFAGLAKTTSVLQEIQELLDLLMERDSNLAELERKLKEFEEMSRRISDIKDREREIRDETDAIRNALTPEQKEAINRSIEELKNLGEQHEQNRQRLKDQFGDKLEDLKDVDATLDHLKKTIRELDQRAKDL
ncbi:MAG: hypothetical protein CMJ90_04095, partial [Planctomycetes bacterium]|nr:hypothetical protein [Planctomycetota bacterium]